MRITYIVGTYPRLSTTFISQEIMVLRELGHQVNVISIRRPDNREEGVTYLLPAAWLAVLCAHLSFAALRPSRYFGLLGFLLSRPHPNLVARLMTFLHFGEGVYAASLVRKAVPAHVHAHFLDRASLVAMCVSRLLDVPYSLTAHAHDIFVRPVLVREKIQGSAFTVTVSRFNRRYLLRQDPELPEDRILVLHPWVDLARFCPIPGPFGRTRLRILSVARLVEKKGHFYLIEACRVMWEKGIDFECQIVGDGPLFNALRDQIRLSGLARQVELLGEANHDEIVKRLSECDIFVLPCVVASDGDRDGMPVALAEAMAMEVPVVTTAVAGINEMVQPGTGLLVAQKDPAALADAIEWLDHAGPEVRQAIGKRGRAIIAKEFDLKTGVRLLADQFARSAMHSKGFFEQWVPSF
ncbi:MAG: glycosyltransferase [Acidobacteriota bacterium]